MALNESQIKLIEIQDKIKQARVRVGRLGYVPNGDEILIAATDGVQKVLDAVDSLLSDLFDEPKKDEPEPETPQEEPTGEVDAT